MKRLLLKIMLLKHEGKRDKPYRDTTGHLTVGVGRNLDAVPFSEDEITLMLDNDINRVWQECSTQLAAVGFNALDDARQHVLMDMCFNLGIDGLRKFEKMLAAVAKLDFDTAANEIVNSLAAKQAPERYAELSKRMRDGA